MKLKQIIRILLNFYLILSISFFLIHLLAPILGGKLLYSALVTYGSWIGMALVLKFLYKRLLDKFKIKPIELFFVTIYCICCMFLWFSYPVNIFFILFIIIGDIAGYKAQGKWRG